MSSSTDPEFDLELHFLPAWAQQPAAKNRYAEFPGETDRGERRGGPGRDRLPGRRNRPPPGPGADSEPRGPEGAGRFGRGRGRRPPPQQAQEPLPLPELNVAFVPDDHGVDSLTRQIRMTGRAYPLFGIARMILQKPERHGVTVSIRKDAQGQPKQPLFTCAIDSTLWLSEDEAVRHVLSRHFDLFYKAERTPIDPPKGTYTFVAQCGMSGAVLGPPNYHDYQKQLRKLHSERFSRVPFEVFKARVKIVRDEAVVKQWIEDQSFRTEYVCLNLPETVRLASREDVEQHFRSCHLSNIIQPAESFHMPGTAIRDIRAPGLNRLIRLRLDEQRRFPLQVMTSLSQQFASRGLQFFKVNRTVTHVAVARPHYLDLDTTPVSEGVRRIVQFVDQHPRCTRKTLLETLAPLPAPPAPPEPPAGTGESLPAEPSPEQTAVITDLHWLIHQGHVIEFATGLLETAKRPLPRPPRPERAPAEETLSQPPPEGQITEPPAEAAPAQETTETAQSLPSSLESETLAEPPSAEEPPAEAAPARMEEPCVAESGSSPSDFSSGSDAAPVPAEAPQPEVPLEERASQPDKAGEEPKSV